MSPTASITRRAEHAAAARPPPRPRSWRAPPASSANSTPSRTSRSGPARMGPGGLPGRLLSGGGGYCDPLEREPERVRADVLAGFVSLERARDVYGVAFSSTAIDDSLQVDEQETARLRVAR